MPRFKKQRKDMNIEQSLASKLLSIKAIKLSPSDPFTWASGLRSPIYCDNRLSLSYPEVRNMIKNSFKKIIEKHEYDVDIIIGVATAGIPHGALLADCLDLPFAYVRSKSKGHGRQNIIEGQVKEGMNAIVVEDLISTGGSCLKAVDVLREINVNVVNVFSIFTYNLDEATENFSAAKCSYLSLTNYPSLLETAKSDGTISDEDYVILKEWYKSPQSWSQEYLLKKEK